jgi:hypothetical protein
VSISSPMSDTAVSYQLDSASLDFFQERPGLLALRLPTSPMAGQHLLDMIGGQSGHFRNFNKALGGPPFDTALNQFLFGKSEQKSACAAGRLSTTQPK